MKTDWQLSYYFCHLGSYPRFAPFTPNALAGVWSSTNATSYSSTFNLKTKPLHQPSRGIRLATDFYIFSFECYMVPLAGSQTPAKG